jgi:hypothetical protein
MHSTLMTDESCPVTGYTRNSEISKTWCMTQLPPAATDHPRTAVNKAFVSGGDVIAGAQRDPT